MPTVFGTSLSAIRLWSPAIGWLLTTIAAAELTLTATGLTTAYLPHRHTIPPEPRP